MCLITPDPHTSNHHNLYLCSLTRRVQIIIIIYNVYNVWSNIGTVSYKAGPYAVYLILKMYLNMVQHRDPVLQSGTLRYFENVFIYGPT